MRMKRVIAIVAAVCVLAGCGRVRAARLREPRRSLCTGELLRKATARAPAAAPRRSPGAGPVIVFETAKGTFEIETYPNEAPKTVEHILALVKRNFYNGLRFTASSLASSCSSATRRRAT